MEDGSLSVVALVTVFAALVAYGLVWATDTAMDRVADEANWSSVERLDLPVNVTRTILPHLTTFDYEKRGDEKAVIYRCGDYADTSRVFELMLDASSPLRGPTPFDAWPTVDLVIVRENCTEERYVLPTRGGPVRGCA